MEDNEDEPEDVKNATPVEEEIKRGEIDEDSGKPEQPFESSSRKRHRCEKNVSKKKAVKTEGECCRAKLAKANRAPKTATVFVYEKECSLPKIKAIPRHCLSKDEWIDILATPSRRCPPPSLRKAVTRKVRPVSTRMAELAQPPKQRLLNTLQDRAGTLPTELVDNLIQTLEGETCLTPEQAERMFRDKDNRGKTKKCRKKNGIKCRGKKSGGRAEPGLAANGSSLDKDAVHCQYLMAESFVRSILEWKCPIPRTEFKDIADVMLKRLGSVLDYSPSNGEDRKSQQMRFLADVIASWIAGVLFEVAEARRTELEEECERRRKETEEETEEDESEDSEDDDDDVEGPKGGGGPRRKGEEDKRKKDDGDGKDEDDDDKPGRPVRRDEFEDPPEADGLGDPVEDVKEERPSKSESPEEEAYLDARTEPESPSEENEKKTLTVKREEARWAEEEVGDESTRDDEVEKRKEDKTEDKIKPLAGVETVPEPEMSWSQAEESEIGKLHDDGVFKKPFEASRSAEQETKAAETFVDYVQSMAGAQARTGRESMATSEVAGPTITASSGEEAAIIEVVMDERAAGDRIDDRETAAKPAKIPEDAEALEAQRHDAEESIAPADGGDAGTEARKGAFEKVIDPSKDPTESARAEEAKEIITHRDQYEDPKVIELFEDPYSLAPDRVLEEMETDGRRVGEPKEALELTEDPTTAVKMEWLRDKRSELGKERLSKVPSSRKRCDTDAPFVTFDKIFHTIYNAIEASGENPGGDSVTNRIHRAVYEKFANVVREENPGPLPDLTRDVLDVMSGKIALWLRDVLTDSQLSFVNKFPATVESVEVREWNDWIGKVFDTANTWSAWIQRTIRQAESMRSHEVTRGDWRDWTKSVETDALRWRRFYLESVHRAHQNLTMIRDRHVVKTCTRNAEERKEEYEEEIKITDFEVER